MAIPTNINPLRWLASSFGMQWDGTSPIQAFKLALPTVARILGLTQERILSLLEQARVYLETDLGPQLENPRIAITLDSLTERAFVHFKQGFESLGREQAREIQARLGEWVETHLIVPPEDFIALQPYIFLDWMLRKTPDDLLRSSVRRTQAMMRYLLMERPSEFTEAFRRWKPIADPMTSQGRSALQAQGHILHKVWVSLQEWTADAELQHIAIITLLEAWREAYETSILDACQFLHAVTLPPKEKTKGARKSAGVVFNELVRWFKVHDIPFPFFEKLVMVRNKLSHRPRFIDVVGRRVYFGHADDPSTLVLSFEEVKRHVIRDVWTATYFVQGTFMGVLEHANQAGKFDDAWTRLERAVGGHLSVSDGPLDLGEAKPFDAVG